MTNYLCIDLGGTKTSVSIGDEQGRLLSTVRFQTEASSPPDLWLERVKEAVAAVLQQTSLNLLDLKAVGLAVPGPMSVASGTVLLPPNMPLWVNVPVRTWIQSFTGLPVCINNDANAAALAEFMFGEFKGTNDLVYLTMSTGIGAGVVSGGRLLQGSRDLAGEVGHMVVDAHGLPCPCGQKGCWEMYCGGRNLALRMQRELSETGEKSLVIEEAGGHIDQINIQALDRALRRGDRYAKRMWDEYLEHLAHGIGIVSMCFNPSAIILGTIGIHMHDVILPYLDANIGRFAWPVTREGLQIRPSRLGSQIGDLGALALAITLSR